MMVWIQGGEVDLHHIDVAAIIAALQLIDDDKEVDHVKGTHEVLAHGSVLEVVPEPDHGFVLEVVLEIDLVTDHVTDPDRSVHYRP